MQTFRDLYDFIQKAQRDEDGFVAINHPNIKLKVCTGVLLTSGSLLCFENEQVVLKIKFLIPSQSSVGRFRREDRVELSSDDFPQSGFDWSKEFPLDSPLYRVQRCELPNAEELYQAIKNLTPIEDYDDDEHGEMALIGIFSGNSDELIMYVNTEDTYLQPHFHLRNTDHSFQTSIEFLRPLYLPHIGQRRDLPNEKQVDWLIGFFKTDGIHPKFSGSIWDLACWDWERNNEGFGLPDDLEMPDYRELLWEDV